MSKQVTLTFERVKDTKNTTKYEEVAVEGQPPVVGTLYVQKWWANGSERVTVTLSA